MTPGKIKSLLGSRRWIKVNHTSADHTSAEKVATAARYSILWMLAPQQPLFDWTVQHLSCCSALVSIKVIKPQRRRLQGQKGKMLFFSSFMIKRCNWDLTETSIEKRTSHNMGPY